MTKWLGLGWALTVGILFAIWQIQVSNMRANHSFLIGEEQKATRAAQTSFDAYKLEVEQTIGNNARQHADDLQKALDDKEALAAENDRLRQQYATAKNERDEESRNRIRDLNNAPRTEDSLLDAPTRDYYRGLRERQTAARPASDQATRGNPP